jgi:hypothetical protein
LPVAVAVQVGMVAVAVQVDIEQQLILFQHFQQLTQ